MSGRLLTTGATWWLCLAAWLAGCGGSDATHLSSIAVGPPDASLAKGLTSQFTATGVYTDGTRQNIAATVRWSSSDASVAAVSNAGLVTASSAGSTMISATQDGVSGTTKLTVVAASLVSIGVTPSNPSVAAGLTHQFAATGVYTDNSIQDLTAAVSWSSSTPAVSSISNASSAHGLATTMGAGSTIIMATLGDVSGSTAFTVTSSVLESIGVTPANLSLAAGLTHQFAATGVYTDHSLHDLSTAVVWNSSAPAVAAVSNAVGSAGVVSADTPGSATLTASLGSLAGTTLATVTPATLVSIGVTPATVTAVVGLKYQFVATGVYTDNSMHDLTPVVVWSSSAPNVATLSNAPTFNGLASALSPGSSTVTAATGSIMGTATLIVSASTLVSIAVTPVAIIIPNGGSTQLAAIGLYADNSTQVLTTSAAWTSSAPTVAVVSNAAGSNGLTTATGQGLATITAALGTLSGSATVTVSAAALVSIGVTPPTPSIADGLNQQFMATGAYTDNTTQDLTTSVAWSSSSGMVASVSNAPASNGLATSLNPGTTSISAAFGGLTGSALLSVSSVRLLTIGIAPASSSLAVDGTQQFTAIGTFSDNSTSDLTAAVLWASSDPTIASVANAPGFNGSVTALAQGSARISASLGAVTASTPLTVVAAPLVAVNVTPATSSVALGTQQQFTAIGTYANGSSHDLTTAVTWQSSSMGTASISNASGTHGLATSLAVGSTTISAALLGISGSASLTVIAATLVSIAVTPIISTIETGTSRQFTATGTYTNHSNQNLTASVVWSSSNANLASISNAANSKGLTSAATAGSVTVSAAVGAIRSTAAAISIAAAPEFAYVANSGDNTVSQYIVGTGGTLTASLSGPVQTGAGPFALAVDPTGHYAYVANGYDNTVSQFAISSAGALTAMTAATVAAGNYPQSIAVDPTDRYVYVANNGDNTVSEFIIGPQGALVAMSPARVATGGYPTSVAVDATGHYVYTANSDGTVSQFALGAGGVLTALSPASVAAGALPQSVAIDPTGRFVYVANGGDNTLSQFMIGTGGILSAMSPATVATDGNPESVSIDPAAHYAYVANQDGTVSQYGMGGGGALTSLGVPSVQAGASPQYVIVDLTGRFVYVANEGNDTVSEFLIGAGGALPAAESGSAMTGSGPYAIATAY